MVSVPCEQKVNKVHVKSTLPIFSILFLLHYIIQYVNDQIVSYLKHCLLTGCRLVFQTRQTRAQ